MQIFLSQSGWTWVATANWFRHWNRRHESAVGTSNIQRRSQRTWNCQAVSTSILCYLRFDRSTAIGERLSWSGNVLINSRVQSKSRIQVSNPRMLFSFGVDTNASLSLLSVHHRLTQYIPYNRNLTRIRDLNSKINQLRNGKQQIISFLRDMPGTEHDPQSFAVDLTLFSVNKSIWLTSFHSRLTNPIFLQEKIILLTVTGIFREKSPNASARSEPLLRSFHRSLVITPKITGGYCIINDMLHVSILTQAQMRTAFKPIAPVPVTTGPVQAPIVPTPTPALAAATSVDDTTKLHMIQEMANGSQMNLEWSKL